MGSTPTPTCPWCQTSARWPSPRPLRKDMGVPCNHFFHSKEVYEAFTREPLPQEPIARALILIEDAKLVLRRVDSLLAADAQVHREDGNGPSEYAVTGKHNLGTVTGFLNLIRAALLPLATEES